MVNEWLVKKYIRIFFKSLREESLGYVTACFQVQRTDLLFLGRLTEEGSEGSNTKDSWMRGEVVLAA